MHVVNPLKIWHGEDLTLGTDYTDETISLIPYPNGHVPLTNFVVPSHKLPLKGLGDAIGQMQAYFLSVAADGRAEIGRKFGLSTTFAALRGNLSRHGDGQDRQAGTGQNRGFAKKFSHIPQVPLQIIVS